MQLLVKQTLLAQCRGAIGSRQFQELWFDVNGETKNIVEGGSHSCAYFLSSILHNLSLITAVHATVSSTVRDMEQNGWTKIELPEDGAVVLWDVFEGHQHLGVYVGNEQAISNSSEALTPQQHDWRYRNDEGVEKRKVLAIYTHPKLNA